MKRNIINKRFFRELKSEFGKYAVIFLFLTGAIGFVSGFLVASDSMMASYEESFEKYNIEDRNLTLTDPVDEQFRKLLAADGITLYENFYLSEEVKETGATLRIFKMRNEVNKVCLMDGNLPQTAEEIVLDRMHAENNKILIGDTITVGGKNLRHYLTLPMSVETVAAIVGNVLGYTVFKKIGETMYYGSYSLPTYVTMWNGKAFLQTTSIPVIIMFLINVIMLVRKLSLSPLRFLRRNLSRRGSKRVIRLNSHLSIMSRFRLRILLQNLPNYFTILIGVFFANLILLFGFALPPLIDGYEKNITSNVFCEYQYVLKSPIETEEATAEKYSVTALQTPEGRLKSEEVMVYGIAKDSCYVKAEFGNGVLVSSAYAGKYRLKAGDEITLEERFGGKQYTFTVDGIYEYSAALAVFMPQQVQNALFEHEEGYFNGYFSNSELSDLDERLISTRITVSDLTKTSRQLKVSMGELMNLFLIFGAAIFMLVIYLLSKLIIEKNAQAISVTKILGYTDSEINRLYVWITSMVVVASLLGTIPKIKRVPKNDALKMTE